MDCFTEKVACYVHFINVIYFQMSLQITPFMNAVNQCGCPKITSQITKLLNQLIYMLK